MKLQKAINSIEFSESDSGEYIIAYAKQRSKTVNKDVSLAPYLPALCTYLDKINHQELRGQDLRNFNDLIYRLLGALLQQEMDDAELRWK